MSRSLAIAFAALAVLGAGLYLPGAAPGQIGAAPPSPDLFRTSFHGNFSAAGPGPNTSVPSLSSLTITYEIQDPSYTTELLGLYVRVPAPAATFNASGTDMIFYLPAKTIAINSTLWTNGTNTTILMPIANATTFTNVGAGGQRGAILSSQTLAVTSPVPYGSLTIFLRWKWVLQPPTGPNVTSGADPWLPSDAGVAVQPDQYVSLSSISSQTISPGQSFGACVSGTIANRTFSLHAQTLRPVNDFVQVNATVPPEQIGPYCWSVRIPSWVAPQLISVRLWDYVPLAPGSTNMTTILLYQVRVNLVSPGAPVPSLLGVPLWQWAIGAGGLVVALAGLWLRERSHRPGRRPPAPWSPPVGARLPDGGVVPTRAPRSEPPR